MRQAKRELRRRLAREQRAIAAQLAKAVAPNVGPGSSNVTGCPGVRT